MNLLARVRPFLPLAARVVTTAAVALAPIAAVVAAKQPVTDVTLAAAFVAGSGAWKRWHPSASLSALSGTAPDSSDATPTLGTDGTYKVDGAVPTVPPTPSVPPPSADEE